MNYCMDKKINSEELEKKLAEYQGQRDEYLAGWQRSRADFLNYKKEEVQRIGEILKYANEALILKVLPILDSFEKAEKAIPEDKKDEYSKGFLQIKSQLEDILKSQGVGEIEALGKKFDPNFHEAVESASAPDGATADKSGIIIEEVQKGYSLNGKVIRPTKVKINK